MMIPLLETLPQYLSKNGKEDVELERNLICAVEQHGYSVGENGEIILNAFPDMNVNDENGNWTRNREAMPKREETFLHEAAWLINDWLTT